MDIHKTNEESIQEDDMVYFVKGSKEPMVLKAEVPERDYLSDFLRMVKGGEDVILTMKDVIDSARTTLLIQQAVE